MINLGLTRAAQLWRHGSQPWKAIHVAGTNGKGSTCAYLSSILYQFGVKTGRFTSPHVIDRWDCITVDEEPINERLFRQVHEEILERNHVEEIGATPFELLTVTAFEVFTREKVQVAVVETGMGGRDDATNILQHKIAAVLTDIGLDHQKFLGDTVEEIAKVKAGIIKPHVGVVYSASNPESVQNIIKETAEQNHVKEIIAAGSVPQRTWPGGPPKGWPRFRTQYLVDRPTRNNLSVALRAFVQVRDAIPVQWTQRQGSARMFEAAMDTPGLPGRFQTVAIKSLIGEKYPDQLAILDGAHNEAAASSLSHRIQLNARKRLPGYGKRLRNEYGYQPIAWVIGHTQGRDVEKFLANLCWPEDSIATVEFGPVDGMPWVEPMSSVELAQAAENMTCLKDSLGERDPVDSPPGVKNVKSFGRDIHGALDWAASQSGAYVDDTRVPIVVTGSLYLCSDVLRSLRERGAWNWPKPSFSKKRLPPVTWDSMIEADAQRATRITEGPKRRGPKLRSSHEERKVSNRQEGRGRGRPRLDREFLEKYRSTSKIKPFVEGWHRRVKMAERRRLAELKAKIRSGGLENSEAAISTSDSRLFQNAVS